MNARALVESLAHPAYTGRARRPGFVVANILLVSALAIAADAVAPQSGPFVIGVGLLLLVVRGYALPGLPRVLSAARRLFARSHGTERVPRDERELIEAGILRLGREEIVLSSSFARSWQRRVLAAGPRERDAATLADALDIPPERVHVEWDGDLLVASDDGRPFGAWLSRAALVADTASVAELRRRCPQWDALSPRVREAVVATLRLYLDRCPVCDGALTLDRAPSRLRTVPVGDVVAVTCTGCDARLFESSVRTGLSAPGPGGDHDRSSSLVGY